MAMKKILVIDYDQGALASLQGVLIKEGYQVVTAGDGQAGWEKFNKESPDLVLLEAMLPKVHGFELCQRITSERNAQTPVFIMTGVYKDRVYRTEALRTYGAAEYFEKPLKMAELLTSVEAVLGKPEKKPAAEPAPAVQAKAVRPEPVPADTPKVEKPKPVEEEFAWSADLDKLCRKPRSGRRAVTNRR
jgi:DNA-binding response OmpR family regulator